MDILKPGEKLIEKITVRASGSQRWWFSDEENIAYDLYIVELPTKDLRLIVFMKIQFIFRGSKQGGELISWSPVEKRQFVDKFKFIINQSWGGNKLIKTLSSGRKIFLDVRFEFVIDEWSVTEYWELYVKKIKLSHKKSCVRPLNGTVHLDNNDLNLTKKINGGKQRPAIHEFGHMLGLPDEYRVGSPYHKDINSVMCGGEIIRPRHYSKLIKILDDVLKRHNINK